MSWIDRRLLGRPWRDRAADLKATGPEEAAATSEGRTESVREFLLRTPHQFCPTQAAGTLAYRLRLCVCGQPPPVTIHDGEVHGVLVLTTAHMNHVAAMANAVASAGGECPADLADAPAAWMTGTLAEEDTARPWNPDGPHEYSDGDEQDGYCACGAPEANWKHREVPAGAAPEAGPVTSEGGWLAGGPLATGPHAYLPPGNPDDACMTCRAPARHPIHFDAAGLPLAGVQAPAGVAAPVPDPLPDGVLGYVAVLPGRVLTAASEEAGTLGWLANADLMSRRQAEHEAGATGGTLCEVRAVNQ